MRLSTPHRGAPVDASPDAIAQIIQELPGKVDPFVILSGDDELRFLQTLWTPSGHVLEFQEGAIDRHFRCNRQDLTSEEVVAAFCDYLKWQGHTRPKFQCNQVEVRTLWYRVGHTLGSAMGRLVRVLRG